MRKEILVGLLAVFSFIGLVFAGSDSLVAYFGERVKRPDVVDAQRAPFNYVYQRVRAVDSSNYTPPAGVTIQQIKALKAGNIRFKTWTDSTIIKLAAGIVEPISVRKVFDSLTTADSIIFYGHR